MTSCRTIRNGFSAYLDGALTGVAMRQTADHLDTCAECRDEFAAWRSMQDSLATLGSAKAPANLALRLRVAISQERARTARRSFAHWQVRWQNTFAPFLLRASAGFASSALLLGGAALLVCAFATPVPVEARDAANSGATAPRFLYSMPVADEPDAYQAQTASLEEVKGSSSARVRAIENANSIVVEAFVDKTGRVYDYRILSGPNTPASRARIENLLLFSVFAPAYAFGQPVSGVAVLSFSGIAVQG